MKNILKNIFFFVALISTLNILYVDAARYWDEQFPLSIPADADTDRPYGNCNMNDDCPSGSNCSAWGRCDI